LHLGSLSLVPSLAKRQSCRGVYSSTRVAATGASLWTWSAMPWLVRAGLIFVAYASHVGLDCFTPGRALMLDWPLSRRRYQARQPWFLGITIRKTRRRAATTGGPWHLLRAIGREILLISPGVVMMALARKLS
jgi:hypothetical protein